MSRQRAGGTCCCCCCWSARVITTRGRWWPAFAPLPLRRQPAAPAGLEERGPSRPDGLPPAAALSGWRGSYQVHVHARTRTARVTCRALTFCCLTCDAGARALARTAVPVPYAPHTASSPAGAARRQERSSSPCPLQRSAVQEPLLNK